MFHPLFQCCCRGRVPNLQLHCQTKGTFRIKLPQICLALYAPYLKMSTEFWISFVGSISQIHLHNYSSVILIIICCSSYMHMGGGGISPPWVTKFGTPPLAKLLSYPSSTNYRLNPSPKAILPPPSLLAILPCDPPSPT